MHRAFVALKPNESSIRVQFGAREMAAPTSERTGAFSRIWFPPRSVRELVCQEVRKRERGREGGREGEVVGETVDMDMDMDMNTNLDGYATLAKGERSREPGDAGANDEYFLDRWRG